MSENVSVLPLVVRKSSLIHFFPNRFRLKGLQESADVEALAEQIVFKSSGLIDMRQIPDVISIINYLKRRRSQSSIPQTVSGRHIDQLRPKTASARLDNFLRTKSSMEQERQEEQTLQVISSDFWRDLCRLESEKDACSLGHLDSYIEMLYDEGGKKKEGAANIYWLSQDKDNLDEITNNETLLCVLARMLREEGKKSLELATLVVAIFSQLSMYHDFHPVIAQYKFGSACLDLVQHEINREETWFQDMNETRKRQKAITANGEHNGSTNGKVIDSANSVDYDKSLKKYQLLVKRQNHFLKASFILLMNLSEDKKVEVKMLNKGILPLLVKSLEREALADFFLVIQSFLTRLARFLDNKNQLRDMSIIEKLYAILSASISNSSINIPLIHSNLSLLVNLSFDSKMRNKMVSIGVLPKLLYLWSRDKLATKPQTEKLMLLVLYHMSHGVRLRGLFNFSFGVGMQSMDIIMNRVMRVIEIKSSGESNSLCRNWQEILALAVNLSLNEKNAKKMSEDGRLQVLLEKVFMLKKSCKEADLLSIYILKILRNMSFFVASEKSDFEEHADAICKAIFLEDVFRKTLDQKISSKQSEKEDLEETFVLECLGILSNMGSVPSVNWIQLYRKYSIWPWMKLRLNLNSSVEDDVVLAMIVFMASSSLEEATASFLSSNKGFFNILLDILRTKQEDDEIVLQTVCLINTMTKHKSSRQAIQADGRVTQYMTNLMTDKNMDIRSLASETLNLLSENNSSLTKQIRLEKFKNHNKKWIDMMERHEAADDGSSYSDDFDGDGSDELFGDHDLEDDDLNIMLKADLLSSSLDSVSDPSLTTPSRMGWDMNDLMDVSPKSRPVSTRPTTSYKRR